MPRRSHYRGIRNHSECFLSNIFRGVVVTLVGDAALLTLPLSVSKRQIFLDPPTLMAGLRAGIPAIDQLHVPAILFGFVEQLPLDLEETGIGDRLRQLVIRQHSPGIEIFQPDQGIRLGKIRGHLVQAIGSLVGDARVGLFQLLLVLPPILAAFHFARQPLGEALDSSQVAAIVLLILKHLALTGDGQRLDAQLDPNHTAMMWRRDMRNVYVDGHKPVARLLENGGREDLACKPQRLGQVDLAQKSTCPSTRNLSLLR